MTQKIISVHVITKYVIQNIFSFHMIYQVGYLKISHALYNFYVPLSFMSKIFSYALNIFMPHINFIAILYNSRFLSVHMFKVCISVIYSNAF